MNQPNTVSGFRPDAPEGDPTWREPDLDFDVQYGPAFPADVLPAALRDFVAVAASGIGVAPDMVAMPGIGIAAGAIQRVLVVSGLQHAEQTPLWIVAPADSGERKTEVLRQVKLPIEQAQDELRRRYGAESEQSRRERKEVEATLAKLTAELEEARREERAEDVAKAETRIRATQERIPAVLAMPQILVDDATPEALARKLAQQRGRVVLASDEAAKLFGHALGTAYGNGEQTKLDVFLQSPRWGPAMGASPRVRFRLTEIALSDNG